MLSWCRGLVVIVWFGFIPTSFAQVRLMGKVWIPRTPDALKQVPVHTGLPEDYFASDHPGTPTGLMAVAGVRCFASLPGSHQEAMSSFTWSTSPAGWYNLSGGTGRYTLLFSGPSAFIRPVILTNVYTQSRDVIDRKIIPPAWYGVFEQQEWDNKPAAAYYQLFEARGPSVTHVGFKLVHDGVDGIGPGAQNAVVSIHRQGSGNPDTWERVGPAVPVLQVDCGGAKDYEWSAAWNSGEVPTVPGGTYAVRIAPERSDAAFQAFWGKNDTPAQDCYRVARHGPTGFVGRSLWMYVAGDGDGLLIPVNKHIQKEHGTFAGFAKRWSQTYVAQGRSLASVIVYAATSGSQPSINRQRAALRVRKGGPTGAVVGTEKIAIGLGIHTGDASWGTFGTVLAPGEVVLEPGTTYAIELESIENHASLHGYVNIKGVVSDDRPGFNPYRQQPGEDYPRGTAYREGSEDARFDLDMQIVEYEHQGTDWSQAVAPENLLAGGEAKAESLPSESTDSMHVEGWSFRSLQQGTTCQLVEAGSDAEARILRIAGDRPGLRAIDGYLVRPVAGLTYLETYRLSGQVRSSWPWDFAHACLVGIDTTGQLDDVEADTIQWAALPSVHSHFVDYQSEPIRTRTGQASIWLRGKASPADGYPFSADFVGFALRRVDTGIPRALPQQERSGRKAFRPNPGRTIDAEAPRRR